jgi:hypothetical protein
MNIRIAYIILAHKNPVQLGRLIKALQATNVNFFVHVDKKVALAPFRAAVAMQAKTARVTWVKRAKARWGRMGIVLGTLNALEEIAACRREPHRIILLSGMDYPIKSTAAIEKFFEDHPHANFIEYFPLTSAATPEWMFRLERYHFNLFGRYLAYPSPSQSWARRTMDALLTAVYPRERRFPDYLQPYGGSQWWCITMAAALDILTFVHNHPDYVRYHADTHIPDEVFFHSIVLNSADEAIRNSLVKDNLKFIDWSRPKPRPAVFSRNDYNLLVSSPKLFARKFDINKDSTILDMLDEKFAGESIQVK